MVISSIWRYLLTVVYICFYFTYNTTQYVEYVENDAETFLML